MLLLDPLCEADILAILAANLGVPHPSELVQKARTAGVYDLLDNPQSLQLLVQATAHGGAWPSTRDDMYSLACERLVQESNKRHRDRQRGHSRASADLLAAAGQLSAVLLFSNLAGIALDAASVDGRFVNLDDCSPPDTGAASAALSSKLFRAEAPERMAPSHRSVAEYLAARWLAVQIDSRGLPLGRVLSLLLGRDSRAVAGLRGLYGWLALHSRQARQRLIEADPLTVVIYGDVKPMTVGDKRQLIKGLRHEARTALFQLDHSVSHRLGALADVELEKEFLSILGAEERSDVSQSLVVCVLDILLYGEVLPDVSRVLSHTIRDDSRWPRIRQAALRSWSRSTGTTEQKLRLLEDIEDDRVTDRDDELTGILLDHLYPHHIAPDTLLRYLHEPKQSNLLGTYRHFWEYHLPEVAPVDHLPMLLDGLVARDEHPLRDPIESRLSAMADKLLAKAVVAHGDLVSDERLWAWLGVGSDEYGAIRRGEKEQSTLARWLEERPKRYRQLLGLCFQQCENNAHAGLCVSARASRFHGAAIPEDLGRWHLEQASLTSSDEAARIHLREAAQYFVRARGGSGLSLDDLVAWGPNHPARAHWLEPLLYWEVPQYQLKIASGRQKRIEKSATSRRERTKFITPLLQLSKAGTASAHVMHVLAGVWMNRYTDITGETPDERFGRYSENGHEVLEAARAGFAQCLHRADLPTVEQIIDLNTKSKEHFVRLPCLVGMDLLWQGNPSGIAQLSGETLRRVLAFQLTHGDGRTPAWFYHLLSREPASVAEVLVDYASATLKAGLDFVNGIYALQNDATHSVVATIAAPRLLEAFPVRARSGQLTHLEHLLKAALRHAPEALAPLIRKKLSFKGMDVAQRVYWRAAAMLLDREAYEASLWRYVGNSEVRISYLSGFLSERRGKFESDRELSVRTMGKLIERLTPHAEVEWPNESVRDVSGAVQRGDQVRGLIASLGAVGTDEAAREIERLISLRTLKKVRWQLESARHHLTQRQRESDFRFVSSREVAQVFANHAPINMGDFSAMVLAHVDELAVDIRSRNDDLYRPFWTEGDPNVPKKENSCRDSLLTQLKQRLVMFGIDCDAEGDYVADKRADITLSYRSQLRLPVEVKRESHRDLWTALRKQLITRYTVGSGAEGYGIYVVLWFGGAMIPPAPDGGKRPRSPDELRARLEAQLDNEERKRISVRVVDVSWPM